MSDLYRPAFADPHYAVERHVSGNVSRVVATGTPTGLSAPAAGYDPGCTWQNRTKPPTLGTILYVNTGDDVTAIWTNVV